MRLILPDRLVGFLRFALALLLAYTLARDSGAAFADGLPSAATLLLIALAASQIAAYLHALDSWYLRRIR